MNISVSLFATIAFAFSSVLAMADGGISGGGGGTLPSNPIGPVSVRSAIQQSRLSLYLYFNHLNQLRRSTEVPSASLLFDGSQTIFDVIRTASIELNEDGPCFNRAHEAFDGTAPGSKPNSICISVKNISSKLTIENYWNQTIALVGHEFSHLLGADEAQASAIQRKFVEDLGRLPTTSAADMAIHGGTRLDLLRSTLQYFIKYPEQLIGGPAQLNQFLLRTMANLNSMIESKALFNEALSAFDAQQLDLWWGAFWKLQMLSYTACSWDHSPGNPRDQICQDWVDQTFQSDSELSLPLLEGRMHARTHGQNPPGFKVRRITSKELFDLELNEIVQILSGLGSTLEALPMAWSGFEPGQTVVPTENRISWKTNRVSLSADDFHIVAGGTHFYGNPSGGQLRSDPGHQTHWTFEAEWKENGRPMKLNFYFKADATHWWVDQIRAYDGQVEREWAHYHGEFFKSPLGTPFVGDLDMIGWSENNVPVTLHFRGLKLQMQLH